MVWSIFAYYPGTTLVMPRHAFYRFSKRTAPYSRPVRRIGLYQPCITCSRTMDEEAVARGVAAARTAIPCSIPPSGAHGVSTNVHRYARWCDTRPDAPGVSPLGISCNFGADGWTGLVINFELHDVSHVAELQALYDLYRIDKVALWFDYSPDTIGTASSDLSARLFPKLWIKRNYNDSNNPTLSEMEQSNQTQCLRFTASQTTLGPYFIRPAAQVGIVDAAAVLQPTVSTWAPWLRTVHPRIEHYSLNMVAQGLPSVNLGAITIRVRYHLTMKNVR